jgi:hypothetical protein
MNLNLRTDSGFTEAIVCDDCGFQEFYHVADLLKDELHVRFIDKMDGVETVYWDFKFHGQALTLHYNIYLGISVFPRKLQIAAAKANDAVVEVARFVEERLLFNSLRQAIA